MYINLHVIRLIHTYSHKQVHLKVPIMCGYASTDL